MSLESFKNITPLTFYFVSVVCFVLANVTRDKSLSFYYILLVLGVVFFFMGILKRLKTKR
ncbi:hypothetical protein [Flavobacterium johnsoniae]|jgi:hypothetical protein|uniref:Uncharacterized protein n=1 Tax=Flavobacterium johnsoniae TaxID=986 RepID=A0A1M5JJ49_FLAJO|nr:hypothetical protein [Flavobacterium johnsoniae]OXG02056.1 hypothetical protein B0A63_05210 [Flavobacterium johnsoniae UW101]WQG80176.1 hypothetical protein SR927_19405 [Flavobacterium johnsoniae UW101]SHG40572.1 hypothetical protein SAMN05444388_102559 [Flavobacterium johnsoniae]SHK95823.1 hypothetical protein SAMN05444146_2476 [Flavobacterium johnsoniae]